MSDIDKTLAERGERYGEFTGHAEVTQAIKLAMVQTDKWYDMDDDQKECLEMVAHKIGRILNGDPNYIDSWTDIIGYTRLVEKRLIAEQESAKALMQEGEAAKQMPLFGTRTATADETAKIEELLKGFNPTVGTLSDRNLNFQELKNREARATLDSRAKAHADSLVLLVGVGLTPDDMTLRAHKNEAQKPSDPRAKAHIDAEQAANGGKKCDCAHCQTLREFTTQHQMPKVTSLDAAREAKIIAEARAVIDAVNALFG